MADEQFAVLCLFGNQRFVFGWQSL